MDEENIVDQIDVDADQGEKVMALDPESIQIEGVVESDGTSVVPSDAVQLHELEEQSYACALVAGEAEWMMWQSLAMIRDKGLWRAAGDTTYTFDAYLSDWMHEVRNRAADRAKEKGEAVPALPFSVSLAQKKLALHRRFVDHLECAPAKVLAAPLHVMTTLASTVAAKWDYKTGAPLEIKTAAEVGLAKEFPEEPNIEARIKKAVEVVTAIPSEKQALEYIKERFGPPPEEKIEYRYVVVVYEGVPYLRCREIAVNETTGDAQSDKWYDWQAVWPDAAIEALAKKLGAVMKVAETKTEEETASAKETTESEAGNG